MFTDRKISGRKSVILCPPVSFSDGELFIYLWTSPSLYMTCRFPSGMVLWRSGIVLFRHDVPSGMPAQGNLKAISSGLLCNPIEDGTCPPILVEDSTGELDQPADSFCLIPCALSLGPCIGVLFIYLWTSLLLYLLSIPGFGPYIVAVVLAAIADPLRFDSSNQVVKLAGYDLGANRSGKSSDDAVPVISKNGNAQLRYALYQAAFIASARNPHFSSYFAHELRGRQRERGIKTKMRVKLAAKMLIIAWTLMKKREPFNPDYLHIE